ncbi:MAG TPA: hypothetical protein VGL65_00825 [Gemmatimonadales bacterium]|jgi:hypothetical protein
MAIELACHTRPHVDRSGFRLVALSNDVDWQRFVARIDEVIATIDLYDKRRLAVIRSRVRSFVLVSDGGDHFDRDLRAIVLNERSVVLRTLADLTLLVVHEATHAMIHARGVRGSWATQERVERLCVAEEARFARRMPDGDALAVQAIAKLDRKWWTEDKVAEREEALFRALRIPHWVLRVRRFGRRAPGPNRDLSVSDHVVANHVAIAKRATR